MRCRVSRYTFDGNTWRLSGSGVPLECAPIQHERATRVVPLDISREAYKEYAAQYGTSQSLERLHERGGFGAVELAVLLYERILRLEKNR